MSRPPRVWRPYESHQIAGNNPLIEGDHFLSAMGELWVWRGNSWKYVASDDIARRIVSELERAPPVQPPAPQHYGDF